MKLDATDLRYLSSEEFNVLKACETGSLSHEVVPSALIASTSGLHHAGLNKIMSELSRRGLIARERNIKYDGWRLTYGGYDWLAVRAMREKGALIGVGTRVGVGKESDIYMAHRPPPAASESAGELGDDEQAPALPAVLKVHRLGRISFRKIKEKRDYLGHRTSSPNWMYLSRLAAKKEWLFMQTLFQHGFPVPRPIHQSRHAILMTRIKGYPLRQIVDLSLEPVTKLFASLMALIVRLARAGLIHCDFNEFNIMLRQVRRRQEGEAEGENDDDDWGESDEDEESIWARAKGLVHGGDGEGNDEDDDEYVLGPGERIEKGNGFEMISRVDDGAEQAEEESDDDDEEEIDGRDTEDDEEIEFDEAGTNEALRVELEDGSSIEPILIDFPQMISIEHPNAEYYFDRDVEGVRSFFMRRFRFQSDRVPSFGDVVPADRKKQREQRAARQAKRARAARQDAAADDAEEKAEEDGGAAADDLDKPWGLELDVLTQASGLGSVEREMTALDQYMAAMRVQTENEGELAEEADGSDADEPDQAPSEEDEDDERERELDARMREGTLLPPSVIVPTGRGLARESRSRRKADGAVRVKPGNRQEADARRQDDVESRIAVERQHRTHVNAKHHGKKSQSGKMGRAWAAGGGSKAKTGVKALIENSTQF